MEPNPREVVQLLSRKHLHNFDLGENQFFQRLDNDLDRACFLIFKDKGISDSAPTKVGHPELMSQEEKDFCRFCRDIFNGQNPDEFLKRRIVTSN